MKTNVRQALTRLRIPLLVLFCGLVAVPAAAARHWYGGAYNYGLTMTRAEGPHYVHGYLSIGGSSRCLIEPGVTVYFDQYAGISAGGKSYMKLEGQASAPIILRSSAANPAKGAWSGISIVADAGAFFSSSLSYVQIHNAGSVVAAVQTAPGAKVSISNVSIYNSGSDGAYIQNAMTLLYVTVENSVGNGIRFGAGNVSCQGCTVKGNGGAGIDIGSAIANLIGVTVTNNTGWAVTMWPNATLQYWSGTATGNGSGTKDGLGHRGGPIYGTLPYFSTLPTTLLSPTFISSGTTLTIPASATVRFASGAYLDVQGKLVTSGTASAPTTFMGWGASPVAGAWVGVRLKTTTDPTSTLNYLKVRHATIGLDIPSITRSFTSLSVEDSVDGIKIAAGGRVTCTSCSFARNSGNAVNVIGNAGVTLQSSTFTSNTGYVLGLDPAFGPLSVTSCSFSGNKYGVGYRGGSIAAAETWQNIGVDWHVLSLGVSIQPYGGLTIPAGLTVRLWPSSQISVAGRLTAEGTATQRVRFTRYPEYASGGNWGQIYLNSSTSRLVYADLEHGGAGAGSALTIYASTPVVENIKIVAPGGTGLSIQSNSQAYSYLTVSGGGGPAVSISNGNPAFRQSTFLAGTGGAMTATSAQVSAIMCYWGAATGPSGIGPGTGGSVTAGVSYEPWLASPFVPTSYLFGTTVTNRSFNSTIGVNTTIAFQTSAVGNWTLRLLNSAGTVVRTLAGTATPASVTWDGRDALGQLVPAGSYLWQLDATVGGVAAAQQRAYVISSPTTPLISPVSASELYFSPNADSIKETTRVSASVAFESSTWTLRIKNSEAVGQPPPPPPSTRLSATLAASQSASGYPASNAGDTNTASIWLASSGATNNNSAWIQLDLGSIRQIDRVKWQGGTGGGPYYAQSPTRYWIKVSSDGVTWTNVVDHTATSYTTPVYNGNETVNAQGRYLRLESPLGSMTVRVGP